MDILGIGNALVDIFSFSDDETALALGLHPNHASHMEPGRLDELLIAVQSPIYVAGGTAANALKAASALGLSCAFVGCTGTEDRESDRWARMFCAELASFGVKALTESRSSTTGRCLVLHMPGTMKSIACAPGAAPSIKTEQITEELVASARVVFVDGQTLRNRDAFERISALCRERRVPLAVDVASTDIARGKSAEIARLFGDNDCILFLNEDEAVALAVALEPTVPGDRGILSEKACVEAVFSFYTRKTGYFPCIVMKLGEKGARLWSGGKAYEAPIDPVTNVIDDTGAGDVFAGAFLAAYLQSIPQAESLSFANRAARECLTIPGTRLDCDGFARLGTGIGLERSGKAIRG